jgi:hypothetical protein
LLMEDGKMAERRSRESRRKRPSPSSVSDTHRIQLIGYPVAKQMIQEYHIL